MIDLAPELLEKIQKDFLKQYNSDGTIKKVLGLVKDNKTTYADANEYSIRVGEILSNSYKKYLTDDTLPESRLWYNMATTIMQPTLENNYDLIVDVCKNAQQTVNTASKVSLGYVQPALNQNKIDGFINKLSNTEVFSDVQWLIGEPVVNFSQAVVDDSIKANASFHAKSGLTPKIVRKLDSAETRTITRGKSKIRYKVPCKWCEALAGTWNYLDMPDFIADNIFRRHENCRCTVEYVGDGKRQNVWTKKYTEEQERVAQDRIDNSKRLSKQILENNEKQRAQRQNAWQPSKNLDDAFKYAEDTLGLYITDKKGISLDVMNMLNKEIANYYNVFGNLHDKDVLNGLRVVTGKKRYAAAYQKAMGEVILVKSNLTKKGFAEMLEQAIIENKIGFWSTPAREHAIRHELGHAIEKIVKNKPDIIDKISALRNEIITNCGLTQEIIDKQKYTTEQMQTAGSYLSYYSLYSDGEFIAEALAEVMGGNPRETAQRALAILLEGLS